MFTKCFPIIRLKYEKFNVFNGKQFIKTRGREMTAAQESNTLPAPEEKTEIQEGAVNIGKLSSVIHKRVCTIRGLVPYGLVLTLFYYSLTV